MKNEEIENSIDGYKYLVSLIIMTDGMESSPDDICICDTRDCAIKAIKEQLSYNIEANEKFGITTEPYEINRFGGIVKWEDKKNNNKWMWEYLICPVKYISDNEKI